VCVCVCVLRLTGDKGLSGLGLGHGYCCYGLLQRRQ